METLGELVQVVEKKTGIILSTKSRKDDYVMARAIFFKLAKDDFMMGSYDQIGGLFDMNHATVIHSVKKTFPSIQHYSPHLYKIYLSIKSGVRIEEKGYKDSYEALTCEHNDLKEHCKLLQEKNDEFMKYSEDNRITFMVSKLSDSNRILFFERCDAMLNMMR